MVLVQGKGHTHATPLIRLHLFYNIGSGYSHVAARRDNQFDSKSSGLALLNFRKAMAEVKTFAKVFLPPDEVMSAFMIFVIAYSQR